MGIQPVPTAVGGSGSLGAAVDVIAHGGLVADHALLDAIEPVLDDGARAEEEEAETHRDAPDRRDVPRPRPAVIPSLPMHVNTQSTWQPTYALLPHAGEPSSILPSPLAIAYRHHHRHRHRHHLIIPVCLASAVLKPHQSSLGPIIPSCGMSVWKWTHWRSRSRRFASMSSSAIIAEQCALSTTPITPHLRVRIIQPETHLRVNIMIILGLAHLRLELELSV